MIICAQLTIAFILLLEREAYALANTNNRKADGMMSASSSGQASTTRFITNKMCPFAQKVWIALEASGATYDMEEISLYGAGGKPGWFLKLNPKGTVPVLVCHGGTMTMGDSDEILDRFSEGVAEGSKLVPSGEKEEQIKRFRSKLNEFLPIGKKAILGGGNDKMWEPLAELDFMIQGPYVCGDEVTIADCAAFPFLWRIENEFGCMEEEGCKKIKKWLQICQENKAFSNTIQQSWWWWW